ncbi:aspartyl-tRNA(Asn)/glutamyl-tRNA(Gln) amidotransferase subunit A [Brevibacterium iodinum ATCC 49514]|uniref:Aspartyl-tRNA(Asn)/glutamyl-tRNA(Gln) amidotransferase subunit A n=1 Tax=Brevibacterium iodinum ATCC 49514 TaxID=1255616 RepID=A0A2H1J4W1_9MICO|nr:amidase [Brevibacterium iodinum]SMX82496.1 aspartyl-tRNA(Asn)/glutamyl-tRNA(Gln) amidotransferase subunit A [Brevibacterium iodinum ATCC 49514]SUW14320.1 Glutamyl-tRNA(Gln) amidotransferase subunit A [Brevibacterium iodinum]
MMDGQSQPTTGQAHRMDEHTLAEVARAGTQFNAVTAMTDERANALTAESMKRADSGQPPRRLEGIPFAIKDVIDVAGYPTTMGSKVSLAEAAATSAPTVTVLEEAGAIPVAKTNCQEYSYGILGDESAFGRVINPVDPVLCTAGSSSGSAALVAAGAVPLALGTDTAGSVRVPAACQGVFGFKPSFGTVPVDGVFPLSPAFDTVGLFASDLGLLATAFDVIAGAESEAHAAAGVPDGIASGIGRTGRTIDVSLLGDRANRALDLLTEVPNLTVTSVNGQALSELLDACAPIYEFIRLYEAFQVHRDLFAAHAADYQPGVAKKIEAGRNLTEADYRQQLNALADLREQAQRIFATTDFLLTPAIDGPVIRWDEIDSGSAAKFMRYSMPFNVLGWPALTIPLPNGGFARGGSAHDGSDARTAERPRAVQLVGRPGADRALLAFASRLG